MRRSLMNEYRKEYAEKHEKSLPSAYFCNGYKDNAMTDQELKDLVASLAEDTKRMKDEAEKRAQETDKRMRKTDRQIRELGKQIGGLGNKFGSFTEGLAMPSIKQILFDRFGVEAFAPWMLRRVGSETIKLDALGIANGERNEA